jgi:hypothetical protein
MLQGMHSKLYALATAALAALVAAEQARNVAAKVLHVANFIDQKPTCEHCVMSGPWPSKLTHPASIVASPV